MCNLSLTLQPWPSLAITSSQCPTPRPQHVLKLPMQQQPGSICVPGLCPTTLEVYLLCTSVRTLHTQSHPPAAASQLCAPAHWLLLTYPRRCLSHNLLRAGACFAPSTQSPAVAHMTTDCCLLLVWWLWISFGLKNSTPLPSGGPQPDLLQQGLNLSPPEGTAFQNCSSLSTCSQPGYPLELFHIL